MPLFPVLALAGDVPAAEVLAVPTRPGAEGPELLGTPPTELGELLQREKAKGEAGELVTAPTTGDPRVLLVGTGDGSAAALRKAGAALVRRSKGSGSLAIDLRGLNVTAESLRGLAEGLLLGSYGFTQKRSAESAALKAVTIVVANANALTPALAAAITLATASAIARDLVNTPPLEKTPAWLAAQASTLLKGLTVRVRDEHELRAEGWGGLVAVGMGSARPPRVV